jgi:hypothetical protein
MATGSTGYSFSLTVFKSQSELKGTDLTSHRWMSRLLFTPLMLLLQSEEEKVDMTFSSYLHVPQATRTKHHLRLQHTTAQACTEPGLRAKGFAAPLLPQHRSVHDHSLANGMLSGKDLPSDLTRLHGS